MLEQNKELYGKEYDRLQQMQPKSQEYKELYKRVEQMQEIGGKYEFISRRIDYEQEERELVKRMQTILREGLEKPMAQYKLYDIDNHSVLIDPGTNEEKRIMKNRLLCWTLKTQELSR
ncbi:hypothetical protein [Peribacillus frigoritolerans]|uniref:hypothetical protein n=1 Tax=Peribacillus frigoritolerans TaxID=450367 RepID=UPI000BFC2469|nr:hypothetical protein [Peribacillus frigoritolerans]MCR8871651.1 hypothetical protein [Peribacillus frigoritolerans]PHD72378.1 hypothetical protein COF64_21235 [Bacillus sp. AFS043905]